MPTTIRNASIEGIPVAGPVHERLFAFLESLQQVQKGSGIKAWSDVAQSLCAVVGSDICGIYKTYMRTGRTRMLGFAGISDLEIEQYAEYYAKKSVTNVDVERYPEGTIYVEGMYPDQRALRRCEAYNDYFLPLDLPHVAVTRFMIGDREQFKVGVRRGASHGPYGEEDFQVLRPSIPFLFQSYGTWRELQQLKAMHASFTAAMDRAPYGVVFLDGRKRAVFVNREADKILQARDGLHLDREGRLRADHRETQQHMTALTDRLLRTFLRGELQGGGVVNVPRHLMQRPYHLTLFPITPEASIVEEEQTAVGLLLVDPERSHRLPHHMLAELFGFTPAEERVAELLMQGMSLRQIGSHLGVKENTVRWQCKQLFSKTGVERQGELVQLLISSTLPFTQPPPGNDPDEQGVGNPE